MQNVYDIVNEKNLLYILSQNAVQYDVNSYILKKTAIVVNLFYEDTLDKYLNYLKNVPDDITVYLISSNILIYDKIEKFINQKNNTYFIQKENRGRDISALLVAFGKKALDYKYFCFIHDKKEKEEYMKQDIQFWIENLWNNTLVSETYIYNIIGLLEETGLGLLVPPEPIGKHKNDWYKNVWYNDYKITENLTCDLDLQCNISDKKSPITLGTVFWCKTEALKKLLMKNWKYEDFPAEPLPFDGTISHGIERVLSYVAQDAGYDTGIVMCNSYAEKLLLQLKRNMTTTFDFLSKEIGIKNVNQVEHYEEQRKIIREFFTKYKEIYIYGAGYFGIDFLNVLNHLGYTPTGFVVSNGKKDRECLENIPIYEINELKNKKEIGIFIAVNYELQNELEAILLENRLTNYYKVYVH